MAERQNGGGASSPIMLDEQDFESFETKSSTNKPEETKFKEVQKKKVRVCVCIRSFFYRRYILILKMLKNLGEYLWLPSLFESILEKR